MLAVLRPRDRPLPVGRPPRPRPRAQSGTDDPAGPHFHAGGPKGSTIEDQSRSGVNFGWDNTVDGYGTMERYRAIDKPGGDHHFFYEEK
nr:HNH/endonuclease VII fold putative polymorphic toxin [Streptomyces sp. KS 21]